MRFRPVEVLCRLLIMCTPSVPFFGLDSDQGVPVLGSKTADCTCCWLENGGICLFLGPLPFHLSKKTAYRTESIPWCR